MQGQTQTLELFKINESQQEVTFFFLKLSKLVLQGLNLFFLCVFKNMETLEITLVARFYT